MSDQPQFEPKIVGFMCNWCSYRAADLAGSARIKHAPNIRIIRVMCSGRVDPQFVMKAFAMGADGVMMAGCHPGECHYIEQNYKAMRRYYMIQQTLQQLGLEENRFRLVWASAAEGQQLAQSVDKFVADVRKLGPLNWPGNWQEDGGREEALKAIVHEHEEALEVLLMSTANKPKLAMYWAASCGGCEIALLSINEKILDVAAAFDLVLCPCICDGKVRDIEKMADGEIDVCLFNGGIRTSEQEYMALLLRKKSKVLVSYGSCAQEGCIPALGNMNTKQEIFDEVYNTAWSTENPGNVRPQTETKVPEGTLHLPLFYETLKTLDQTVAVDYYLPGCPPEAPRIWEAITAIVSGQLPPKGTVLGLSTTVCEECPRKRTEKKIKAFKRTWEVIPDAETCLLEQGLLCCGVATRAGCGALCPQVNSPCIGCHGGNEGVLDAGARMMTALASVIDSNDPAEIQQIIAKGIPDPVGTFYRFSLAGSLLRRKKRSVNERPDKDIGVSR